MSLDDASNCITYSILNFIPQSQWGVRGERKLKGYEENHIRCECQFLAISPSAEEGLPPPPARRVWATRIKS